LNYINSYYQSLLTITGRHAQAIAVGEHAAKVDPLSASTQGSLGIVLFFARRFDDALAQLKRTLELEPRAAAILTLGATYETLGKPQEALAVYDRSDELRESPYMA